MLMRRATTARRQATNYVPDGHVGNRGVVCLHALIPVQRDVRTRRSAVTLAAAGFTVVVIDVQDDGMQSQSQDGLDWPEWHDSQHDSQMVRARSDANEGTGCVAVQHILVPRFFARYYSPMNYPLWLLFKCWRMLAGMIRVIRIPADAYHASDIAALPGCSIAAWLRRKPLIYDAYELPLVDPYFAYGPHWRLLHAASAFLLRKLLPRCSCIITVSPPLVRALQQRYGGPTATLVRNIPPYHAPQPSDLLRRRLSLPATTKIVLYQGYLQGDRGLERLIRAAKFLAQDVTLVLLGSGESRAALEALILREGVSSRVQLVPPVPYGRLLAWTASADLGLIVSPPAYSANVAVFLPNKLFEYLMAGLPVLSTPLEAVAEILDRYQVGRTFASFEPEALAHAINELLADRETLALMRRNALTAAACELRWDVEQRSLLGAYDAVLGRSSREAVAYTDRG